MYNLNQEGGGNNVQDLVVVEGHPGIVTRYEWPGWMNIRGEINSRIKSRVTTSPHITPVSLPFPLYFVMK